jgi:hypothetical protein
MLLQVDSTIREKRIKIFPSLYALLDRRSDDLNLVGLPLCNQVADRDQAQTRRPLHLEEEWPFEYFPLATVVTRSVILPLPCGYRDKVHRSRRMTWVKECGMGPYSNPPTSYILIITLYETTKMTKYVIAEVRECCYEKLKAFVLTHCGESRFTSLTLVPICVSCHFSQRGSLRNWGRVNHGCQYHISRHILQNGTTSLPLHSRDLASSVA